FCSPRKQTLKILLCSKFFSVFVLPRKPTQFSIPIVDPLTHPTPLTPTPTPTPPLLLL
ncbi:unnamed protein product, partial [Prunus brigantina]